MFFDVSEVKFVKLQSDLTQKLVPTQPVLVPHTQPQLMFRQVDTRDFVLHTINGK